MKVHARYKGVTTELDIKPSQGDIINHKSGVTAVVMQPGIKVTAPDAYKISSEETIQCMKDMSEKAWQHISTGPLFKHFFNMLFQEDAYIPPTIELLLEEDKAVIHGAGLIIMLVEARFAGRKEVFIQTPEDHFHPKQEQHLMSVVFEIQKIPLGGSEEDMLVQVMG